MIRKVTVLIFLLFATLGMLYIQYVNVKSNNDYIVSLGSVVSTGDNGSKTLNIVTVRTKAQLNDQLEIIFTGLTYPDNSHIVGVSGYITTDDDYNYIFIPHENKIWAIKIDSHGNVKWSFYYEINSYVRHLVGMSDNNYIYLIFEDNNGNDYSLTIRKSDGHIISSRKIYDDNFDIFTINSDGYLRQYYSRIYSKDFSTTKLIGGGYPYTIPSGTINKFVILNVESRYTNGGLDYMVYLFDNSRAQVSSAYFFGSKNNDYIYGRFDTFNLLGHVDRAGFIIDNNYAYVLLNDGSTNDYYMRFSIMKISRSDGNYVWVTTYKLPKIGNYDRVELLSIRDNGSYIIINGRLTTHGNPITSSYFIMRVRKSDGSVENHKNDPNTHGFIVISDNNGASDSVFVKFENGYIYMLTIDNYNGKRVMRYIQSPVNSALVYNITINYVNVMSGSGAPQDFTYYRIFTG